jgi:hypothetical protein
MGADEDVDLACIQTRGDAPALGRGRAVRQQFDAHGPLGEQRTVGRDLKALEHPERTEIVLLGEDFGGRHERALVPALHRDEECREGDDGLAGADIALQQPVHGCRAAHVAGDLLDRALLVAGERERQLPDERLDQRTVDPVGDT